MKRLEVSGAVRPLYGYLGVKGLFLNYVMSDDDLNRRPKQMNIVNY